MALSGITTDGNRRASSLDTSSEALLTFSYTVPVLTKSLAYTVSQFDPIPQIVVALRLTGLPLFLSHALLSALSIVYILHFGVIIPMPFLLVISSFSDIFVVWHEYY